MNSITSSRLLIAKSRGGSSTPWGVSDHEVQYGEGIVQYHTPSHGGVRVSQELHSEMPAALREIAPDRWYEEDCDMAAVMFCWPERFVFESESGRYDTAEKVKVEAEACLRRWNNDAITEALR